MKNIVLLLFNIALLILALTTGFFLLVGCLLVVAAVVIYFIVRQKITGKSPLDIAADFSTPPTSATRTETQGLVIEAEYHEIKQDSK